MTLDIGESLLFEAYYALKLTDVYLAIEDVAAVAQPLVEALLLVVALILNLAYDIFQ